MENINKSILKSNSKIGIINRGEAALRFIRAVMEYNVLNGTKLVSVAFYLDVEQNALFVKEADEAYAISSLEGFIKNKGSAYLNRSLMIEALKIAQCDAIWLGWGFLAEDAQFAQMCENENITIISPSSNAMDLLGDKIRAKELAEKTDVPIVPWSRKPLKDVAEAKMFAEKIGYPVIIKAANAGGGRGIRFVLTPDELAAQFQSAKDETIRITGNDIVFMERLVQTGRHLEVQVLADRYGNVLTFGVRDCSVQRKNQKIIEETPPPCFDQETITKMEQAAARLIRAANYESAGTVEFLFDVDRKEFYFMEVNTRLQVEHPITEQLYNIDLVKGQIQVAFGQKVENNNLIPRGVAIELRLNAEDPEKDFMPAPGKVSLYKIPAGPGIRVDSGIEQGSEIPSEFDSMVAKIIALAPTHQEALAKLDRALREMNIKIEGGTTNRAFLLELINNPDILKGGVHTRYVESLLKTRDKKSGKKNWDIALVSCAIEQYLKRYNDELINFKQQVTNIGYPKDIPASRGYEICLNQGGNSYTFIVKAVGNNYYHLEIDNQIISACYVSSGNEAVLLHGNKRYMVQSVMRGDTLQYEVDGILYFLEIESSGFVKSPSPAIVLSIVAKPGQTVNKGDILVTLEAMKMEMIVSAPQAGIVKSINVKEGAQVAAGQPLVQLDSIEQTGSKDIVMEPKIDFNKLSDNDLDSQWKILKWEMTSVFLGYDHEKNTNKIFDKIYTFIKENPSFKPDLIKTYFNSMEFYVANENLFSREQINSTGFARSITFQEFLMHFFKRTVDRDKGLPQRFIDTLNRALNGYPLKGLSEEERLNHALLRIYKSHANLKTKQAVLKSILFALEDTPEAATMPFKYQDLLDDIIQLTQVQNPSLADAAIHCRFQLVDKNVLNTIKEKQRLKINELLESLIESKESKKMKLYYNIIDSGYYIAPDLINLSLSKEINKKETGLELLARHLTRDRKLLSLDLHKKNDVLYTQIKTQENEQPIETILFTADALEFKKILNTISTDLISVKSGLQSELIVYLHTTTDLNEKQQKELIQPLLNQKTGFSTIYIGFSNGEKMYHYSTYSKNDQNNWEKNDDIQMLSPLAIRELRINRLDQFKLKLLYASESVYVVNAIAKDNPGDERLFAMVEVPEARPELDENNSIIRMASFESCLMEAIYAMRSEQAKRPKRLYWNRIIIHMRSLMNNNIIQIKDYSIRILPRTVELGLEKIILYTRRKKHKETDIREIELIFTNISEDHFTLRSRTPSTEHLQPMSQYVSRVVRARQRKTVYPYELIKSITFAGYPMKDGIPRGDFEEYDLIFNEKTKKYELKSMKNREEGKNPSNVVIGIINNHDRLYPNGIRRVIILSDSTKDMGSLAEPECRRIIAAIDLAEKLDIPVEWIPISSGAKIEMDSGTENLDWTASVLRRIIEFTQNGGEINMIVSGINVGAQSYWNAEATMLMHTRGLLIMTDEASMLLTGKKALDFSGSVSAEDNVGIGGVEKIMGPNGEAQIRVKNLFEAYKFLMQHYRFTYREPGTIFPVNIPTNDPASRDVSSFPYNDILEQGFKKIGDIFSMEFNPERKKPFDIRQVMQSVIDQDSGYLERFQIQKDAETSVVWETRIGGYAAGLIGFESRSLTRLGEIPHDGPESWSGGTLFPISSKKTARAINAFSNRLPLIILANLSGFDGSPESLRKLQLEYGAEIGRAIVNFNGPIVFIVISRYHGGAYVVFSKTLNPMLHAAALEGSYASVIGGAPAAAVVFPNLVLKDTYADPRITEAQVRLKTDSKYSQKDFDQLYQEVYAEKQTALAQKFDKIHSVERAKKVGSIDDIINLKQLRPYIIKQIESSSKIFLKDNKQK